MNTLSNNIKMIYSAAPDNTDIEEIPVLLRRFLEGPANIPEYEIPYWGNELVRQARSVLEAMGEDDPEPGLVGRVALGLAF